MKLSKFSSSKSTSYPSLPLEEPSVPEFGLAVESPYSVNLSLNGTKEK